ncbi:MAG: hypothetical protein QXX91_06115, partial [Thermoplasmata archaeon]
MKPKYLLDYQINTKWQPKTSAEWIWYLERKNNYDDWKGLKAKNIRKYFSKLRLNPDKKLLLRAYFKHYS